MSRASEILGATGEPSSADGFVSIPLPPGVEGGVSSAPLSEVRTVAELRDFTTMLDLDPEGRDPEMHYRWARDDRGDIRKHQLAGYRIVSEDEAVRPIAGSDNAEDGTQRVGDAVLMAIPRKLYDERAEKERQLQEAKMSAPVKQFKKNVRRRGAKVLREEEE